MFKTPGSKIKTLATFLNFVGIIFSFVYAIVQSIDSSKYLVGFLIFFGGGIASWQISLVLFDFGQLAEDVAVMVRRQSPAA